MQQTNQTTAVIDYEGYDEDEIGNASGLYLPEVCNALRGAVQRVHQYSVVGGYEKSFNCRKPLVVIFRLFILSRSR